MVTTRSQDRKEASSPLASVPLNKRKRFISEEPENNIVVEVPVQQSNNLNGKELSKEITLEEDRDQEDDDDAPETLSNKAAAQEARGLPNRSLQQISNKRRKTTKDAAGEKELRVLSPELKSLKPEDPKLESSENEGEDSVPADDIPSQHDASDPKSSKTPGDDLAPSYTTPPQNEASEARALRITEEESAPLAKIPAQTAEEPETVESSLDIARESSDEKPPALERAFEVSTPLAANKATELTDTTAQLNSVEILQASTQVQEAQPSVELGIPASDLAPEQNKIEAQHQDMLDAPIPESSGAISLPPLPDSENPVPEQQPLATPPGPEIQIQETAESDTSSIITPVWKTRPQDESHTPIKATDSPSTTTKTSMIKPSHRTSQRHQVLLSPKSKPTSLQQYRDRHLNRHPRTATWGPSGFRKTKFVRI